MRLIILHWFRVKHEKTGKWYTSLYKITIAEAIRRYGNGNYKLIKGTAIVRYVSDDPMRNSARLRPDGSSRTGGSTASKN